MELSLTRQLLEVFQGSPRTRVKQWAMEEAVEFTIVGIEWNLIQLARFVGAGVTKGTTNAGSTWSFGGDTNVLESALLFRHVMPVGHTIDVYIWRCQPSAEMRIPFGDEVHEFGASFRANTSTLDWGGTALPSVQQLVRIRRFV